MTTAAAAVVGRTVVPAKGLLVNFFNFNQKYELNKTWRTLLTTCSRA